MQVIFSHGKESGPDGRKITMLRAIAAQQGADVVVPDYREAKTLDERQTILARVPFKEPTILVGSSMGGWLSMAAAVDRPVLGLFLLAPASGDPYPYVVPRAPNTMIIHGLADEVVPYQRSVELAQNTAEFHNMSPAAYDGIKQRIELRLIHDSHRLLGHPDVLCGAFRSFLHDCSAAWAAYNGVIF